jgi:hypothetical protein
MSLTLIVPLLLFMLTLALAAWGLPLATAFARTWTRLYTRLAPAEQRERRIEETEYHLFAQTEGDREAGYKSSEIGLRIMGRVVCGVLDDLTWAGRRVGSLLGGGDMRDYGFPQRCIGLVMSALTAILYAEQTIADDESHKHDAIVIPTIVGAPPWSLDRRHGLALDLRRAGARRDGRGAGSAE